MTDTYTISQAVMIGIRTVNEASTIIIELERYSIGSDSV